MDASSVQKAPQMHSRVSPGTSKSGFFATGGTLRKPHYLPGFKHIQASDSGVISAPKSQKNLTWNPYCHIGAQNHQKVIKITPKRFPGPSENQIPEFRFQNS